MGISTRSTVSHPAAACTTLLLAILAACSGTSASKVAGATDADAVPELALTEVSRYGSEQNPDTGFSSLGQVALDAEGRVYAMDGQDMRIRVFDSTGTLLRTIGGRGSGPGEFKFPPFYGIVGDTLWAIDMMASRITLFDLDGRVLSTGRFSPVRVPISGGEGDGEIMPVLMRPGGQFLGAVERWTVHRGPKVSGVDSVPRLLFDASGALVDTVGRYVPRWRLFGAQRVTVGGHAYAVPRPPDDKPFTLLLPDGQIVVHRQRAADEGTATFTVTRETFKDSVIYRRTFAYRPVRYGPELLDSIAMRNARFYSPSGPAKPSMAAFRAIRDKMDFPTFQPPVEYGSVGADGGVWLLREDRGTNTYRWLVLGPDGQARGRIELPKTRFPLWMRGNDVFSGVTDSLGIPWLVRYRLGKS